MRAHLWNEALFLGVRDCLCSSLGIQLDQKLGHMSFDSIFRNGEAVSNFLIRFSLSNFCQHLIFSFADSQLLEQISRWENGWSDTWGRRSCLLANNIAANQDAESDETYPKRNHSQLIAPAIGQQGILT